MFILKLCSKAILQDIIKGISSGVERNYVFTENPKNRLEELVYYAHCKQTSNTKVYIEVKYASKYSSREKRLEIVSVNDKMINIYKISALNRFDKDAIELNRIIDEINKDSISDISAKGILIIKPMSDIAHAKELLKKMNINITIE